MKLQQAIAHSTFRGKVRELMTPGLATEFQQPWYIPLPTNPSTTGMALGGIGNAYTVTAAGTTPILSMIPGYHIESGSLSFNQFFMSERKHDPDELLQIRNFTKFQSFNQMYPLVDGNGDLLFAAGDTEDMCLQRIHQLQTDPGIYQWNAERFKRWDVEFSLRVQEQIGRENMNSPLFLQWLLLDFYQGHLYLPVSAAHALTGNWEHETEHQISCYSVDNMEFQALYPIGSTQYSGQQQCQLTKIQYSPVVPGNEKLSGLPLNYTTFILENPTDTPLEITLLQVLENIVDSQVIKKRPGSQDAAFTFVKTARYLKNTPFQESTEDGRQVCGIVFENQTGHYCGDFQGKMVLSCCVENDQDAWASSKSSCYSSDLPNYVEEALYTGRLNNRFNHQIYTGRELISGALCVSCLLPPGGHQEISFALVLDFPKIDLPGWQSEKQYARFFTNTEQRGREITRLAWNEFEDIQEQIIQGYQQLIPEGSLDPLIPQENIQEQRELITLALNTASFMADATVWDIEDRFLVRECADYPFFNSLDVYFYGSFYLLHSFPRLDGEVIKAFAQAILAEDPTLRRHYSYAYEPHAELPTAKLEGPRAIRGAVIHDLGSPFDTQPDAYDWHNVKHWKDLAPKFILMVLRHYHFTQNPKILTECWEAVEESLEYIAHMIAPGENFPLTTGTDDTFDNLSSFGISVYCGSLWIAGLKAASQIAALLEKHEKAEEYQQKARAAQEEFLATLWDEEAGYFHFYATPISQDDLVAENEVALQQQVYEKIDSFPKAESWIKSLNAFLSGTGDESGISAETTHYASQFQEAFPHETLPQGKSRKASRTLRKLWLYFLNPEAWTEKFRQKLFLDSDDIFADQLLADTYLQVLGLDPITTPPQRKRILETILEKNYRRHSPNVGAANSVSASGSPLEAFQAQDVWIGVQDSIVCALILADMKQAARELLQKLYLNLYWEARIPFGAPEGFNASCCLEIEQLESLGNLDSQQASEFRNFLQQQGFLLEDFRISPHLTTDVQVFEKELGTDHVAEGNRVIEGIDPQALFRTLHETGLKYTAGRYFRPCMIFGLFFVLPPSKEV